MREILSRLRAALTPQAAVIIGGLLLAFLFLPFRDENDLSLESRIERTLSFTAGAGRVEVIIRMSESKGGAFGVENEESIPLGAVAVAQGADDPIVAMQLHEALCTLLGLPASAVSVIMGGEGR